MTTSRGEQLFRSHHLRVFRYLRRAVGHQTTAEDLTQEVFLRAVRALPGYRAEGREVAWLFTIARNVLLNHQRGRARRPDHEELTTEVAVFPDAGRRVALDDALSRLPDQDRDAFLLREVGGLGYEEIATVSGLTSDAVRSRIFRARQALRASLDPAGKVRVRRSRKE